MFKDDDYVFYWEPASLKFVYMYLKELCGKKYL